MLTQIMPVHLRQMVGEDFNAVRALWEKCEGVGLSEGDSVQGVSRLLTRNPDLSWVAQADDSIVGAILAGHDGRRAMLYHLAISTDFRRQRVASRLLFATLSCPAREGIEQCYALAYVDNAAARWFWHANQAVERADLRVFRLPVPSMRSPNSTQ